MSQKTKCETIVGHCRVVDIPGNAKTEGIGPNEDPNAVVFKYGSKNSCVYLSFNKALHHRLFKKYMETHLVPTIGRPYGKGITYIYNGPIDYTNLYEGNLSCTHSFKTSLSDQNVKLEAEEGIKQEGSDEYNELPIPVKTPQITKPYADGSTARRPPLKRKANAMLNPLDDSDDEFLNSLLFDASSQELEIRPTWDDPSTSTKSLNQMGWSMVRSLPFPFNPFKRRRVQIIEVADEPDHVAIPQKNHSYNCCIL